MHHLHPRSRSTSTLFTTTLAISFLVVAAPHLLPCPVDRRQFADSFETPDGKKYRRKRKDTPIEEQGDRDLVQNVDGDLINGSQPDRECPVPKPGGIVGRIMGFKNEERTKPAEVIVQALDTRKARKSHEGSNDVR